MVCADLDKMLWFAFQCRGREVDDREIAKHLFLKEKCKDEAEAELGSGNEAGAELGRPIIFDIGLQVREMV
tara:strand:- start:1999 stop:2211 length:213 start_codon:yes stop_codon:yes gene_type:complete